MLAQRKDGGFRSNWDKIDALLREVPMFAVVPRRWVIKRSLAWLGRYRRLSKDYEYGHARAPSSNGVSDGRRECRPGT